jgi:hypothetical protein
LPYRVVKDVLYGEPYYDKIFDPSKAKRDLLSVYLWRAIRPALEVKTASLERNRGKWLALFYLWGVLEDSLSADDEKFVNDQMSGGSSTLKLALNGLVEATGDSVEGFYRSQVGVAGLPEDPTNFFKSFPLAEKFKKFLTTKPGRPFARALSSAQKEFVGALKSGSGPSEHG